MRFCTISISSAQVPCGPTEPHILVHAALVSLLVYRQGSERRHVANLYELVEVVKDLQLEYRCRSVTLIAARFRVSILSPPPPHTRTPPPSSMMTP